MASHLISTPGTLPVWIQFVRQRFYPTLETNKQINTCKQIAIYNKFAERKQTKVIFRDQQYSRLLTNKAFVMIMECASLSLHSLQNNDTQYVLQPGIAGRVQPYSILESFSPKLILYLYYTTPYYARKYYRMDNGMCFPQPTFTTKQ